MIKPVESRSRSRSHREKIVAGVVRGKIYI